MVENHWKYVYIPIIASMRLSGGMDDVINVWNWPRDIPSKKAYKTWGILQVSLQGPPRDLNLAVEFWALFFKKMESRVFQIQNTNKEVN